NYSVDAPAIVKNIFEGGGYVLNGPVASNVIGYDPNHKRYPYDPQKARELLAKAGYPGGVAVKLYLSSGRFARDREVCQVVAAQMEKGGFKVELVSQEWAIFWGAPASTVANCLFTISVEGTWSMPTLSTTNTFGPGPRNEWPTAIRNSISSSKKSRQPQITRNGLLSSSKPERFSWRTCRSCPYITWRIFTEPRATSSGAPDPT